MSAQPANRCENSQVKIDFFRELTRAPHYQIQHHPSRQIRGTGNAEQLSSLPQLASHITSFLNVADRISLTTAYGGQLAKKGETVVALLKRQNVSTMTSYKEKHAEVLQLKINVENASRNLQRRDRTLKFYRTLEKITFVITLTFAGIGGVSGFIMGALMASPASPVIFSLVFLFGLPKLAGLQVSRCCNCKPLERIANLFVLAGTGWYTYENLKTICWDWPVKVIEYTFHFEYFLVLAPIFVTSLAIAALVGTKLESYVTAKIQENDAMRAIAWEAHQRVQNEFRIKTEALEAINSAPPPKSPF